MHDAKSTPAYRGHDNLYLRLLENQQGKCNDCDVRAEMFHIDHILPRSRGGSDEEENLQLLCPACNLRKGDSVDSPDDYPRLAKRQTLYTDIAADSLTRAKRSQRERARASGLCIACCNVPARPKKSTCESCSEKAYERVKARRQRLKNGLVK